MYVRLALTILRYVKFYASLCLFRMHAKSTHRLNRVISDLLFAILESGKFCFNLFESLFSSLS